MMCRYNRLLMCGKNRFGSSCDKKSITKKKVMKAAQKISFAVLRFSKTRCAWEVDFVLLVIQYQVSRSRIPIDVWRCLKIDVDFLDDCISYYSSGLKPEIIVFGNMNNSIKRSQSLMRLIGHWAYANKIDSNSLTL